MSLIERLKGIFTKPFAVVVVVVIAIGVTVGFFGSRRRQFFETEVVRKLNYIGASQLAYSERNQSYYYGTYAALQQGGYFALGQSPSTLSPQYSFAFWRADRNESALSYSGTPSFTVVAVPIETGLNLRTFAICDDFTVRVATDYGLHFTSGVGITPCHWEPLR